MPLKKFRSLYQFKFEVAERDWHFVDIFWLLLSSNLLKVSIKFCTIIMVIFISIVFILILLNRLVYVNHPISLGFILIFYALVTGLLSIILRNSWFFYLLVLVFLGGVIILIIYISTLSANEKFFLDNAGLPIMFVLFLSLSLIFYFEFNNRINISIKNCFISNVYEQSNSRLTIILILYLLLTILCVVKLVKFEKGPLVRRL